MEKKSLIIGAATGYNYNQLKPWIESINECGFGGDKVLVLGQASEETREKIRKTLAETRANKKAL